MNFTKKVLAVLMAVVFIVSMFTVGSFAAGTPTGTEKLTVTVTTDKTQAEAEDTVTVNVSLTSNYNLTCFRFPVVFDSSVFELPAVVSISTYGTCKQSGTTTSNAVDTDQYIPANYDAAAFDCVLVQWTALVQDAKVGCINAPNGELCFSFNLKVKPSAAGKTGTIFIPSESDLFYYQAIENPADATTFYYLDKTTFVMDFVPANVTIGGDQAALVPNAAMNSNAVINEEKLYVYGLVPGLAGPADFNDYLEATAGSTMRITAAELGFGTGTKIDLVGSDASVIKTYTVIIFGDVYPDSFVDNFDKSIIAGHAQGLSIITQEELLFAADLNYDSLVDGFDNSIIGLAAKGLTNLEQTGPF